MADQDKLANLSNLLKDILFEDFTQAEEFPFIVISGDVDGKGIIWKGKGHNKQIIFSPNPDRFFISETIDLARGKGISVNNIKIIDETELGSTITKSNLREVGRLKGLIVDGNILIDQYIVYDSVTSRLGIGTDQPKSALSIAEDNIEVGIGTKNSIKGYIGTYASNAFDIITDNTTRISIEAGGNITLGNLTSKVNVRGILSVNVNNPDPRAALHVNGSIKFNNTIHLSDKSLPVSGSYGIGDIVWNSNPQPGSYIGWVCTLSGTPGLWNGFGRIE
jgi:hypothetical protein